MHPDLTGIDECIYSGGQITYTLLLGCFVRFPVTNQFILITVHKQKGICCYLENIDEKVT